MSTPTIIVPGSRQTYLGYNVIGASQYNIGHPEAVFKKITTSQAGLITDISAYVTPSANGFVTGYSACIVADISGPSTVLGMARAVGNSRNNEDWYPSSAARWLTVPFGMYLAAGTYWLGFIRTDGEGQTTWSVAYDTGGTDYVGGMLSGGTYIALQTEQSASSSSTTRNHSLRASFLG